MKNFNGVYTALITPFNEDGRIDYSVFKNMIDAQIEAGVRGIVVNSTTGENFNLTKNEKIKTAKMAQKYIKSRSKLIISVGCGSFNDVLDELELYSKYNADAILLNLPCYVRPNFSGLRKFVYECAQKSNIPIILYYVPKRSGQFLNAEELLTLINISPNIIGIKYADSNLSLVAELAKLTTKTIFCGEDVLLEEFLKLGATSAISVASNAFPKIVVNFVSNFKNEESLAYINYSKFKSIIKNLFSETNPILIKHLLNLMGQNVGNTRLPLDMPSNENKNIIKEDLFKLKEQKLV